MVMIVRSQDKLGNGTQIVLSQVDYFKWLNLIHNKRRNISFEIAVSTLHFLWVLQDLFQFLELTIRKVEK